MIIYQDILSDTEIGNDSFPNTNPVPGVVAFQSAQVNKLAVNIETGPASTEEPQEEGPADEVQLVIDIVDSLQLSEVSLTPVEAKKLLQRYFTNLNNKLKSMKAQALGVDESASEEECKAAYDALDKWDKPAVDKITTKIADFKKNFAGIGAFFQKEILANVKEVTWYTGQDADLDCCALVPARYIGDATAPVFYLIEAGCNLQKA